ncbi:hypothetical protein [Spiroplasma endosymbiont of Lasioglossum villosulum]|uniref:hypothetical protein n=2 Tax=unclassified Spiroplasma TaxID=2637901 RepID=UPI0030CC0A60
MNFKKILSVITPLSISTSTIGAGIIYYDNFGQEKLITNISEINLQNIIVEPNLGQVNSGKNEIPTKAALLINIKEANPEASLLTINDFDIVKEDKNNVTIKGKGNYIGEVNLYYTVTNFINKKLTNEKIYALAIDSRNNIFRTQEDKVYKLTVTGIETLMDGLDSGKTARNIIVDAEDNVYVGTDSGVVYKSDGKNRFVKISLPDSTNWIWALTVNKKTGIVYAGNDDGVYSIDKNGNVNHMLGTHDYINSLAVGEDGSVYAGADNRGKIYKSYDGISEFKLIKQRDDAGSMKSLVIDSTNNIFAGSDNGSMYAKMLETGHEIKRLVIDKEGSLFIGVDSNEVYKKVKDSSIFYKMIGIENGWEHILALTTDQGDNLYAAGTEGYLYISKNFN